IAWPRYGVLIAEEALFLHRFTLLHGFNPANAHEMLRHFGCLQILNDSLSEQWHLGDWSLSPVSPGVIAGPATYRDLARVYPFAETANLRKTKIGSVLNSLPLL